MMSLNEILTEPASVVLDRVIQNDRTRSMTLQYAEKAAYKHIVGENTVNINFPEKVREYQFIVFRNLLYTIDRALERGNISQDVRKCLLKNLIGKVILRDSSARKNFEKEYKTRAPGFVLISPTSTCNLHCVGCYANSSKYERVHMEYDIFSRIIREKAEL